MLQSVGLLLSGNGAAGAKVLHIKRACLQRQHFNSILGFPRLDTSTSVFHHAAGASREKTAKTKTSASVRSANRGEVAPEVAWHTREQR